jgi:hypothetical protein
MNCFSPFLYRPLSARRHPQLLLSPPTKLLSGTTHSLPQTHLHRIRALPIEGCSRAGYGELTELLLFMNVLWQWQRSLRMIKTAVA